jgi:hypothetical protein
MIHSHSRIVLAAALAVAATCVPAGCGGRAQVPASYNTHTCKDGTFKIQYPAEWQAESGGKGICTWLKCTSGNAQIKIDVSLASSLLGDLSAAGALRPKDVGADENLPPAGIVHHVERKKFEQDEGVREKESAQVATGLGDARQSEFQGAEAFGVSRGYRVTALARDYRVRVVCRCPAAEWDALKPAFDKIIRSLAPGKPEP